MPTSEASRALTATATDVDHTTVVINRHRASKERDDADERARLIRIRLPDHLIVVQYFVDLTG